MKAHPTAWDSNARDRYHRYKASARVRGLGWDLSFNAWLRIVSSPCAYCGTEPTMTHVRRQHRRPRCRAYEAEPFRHNSLDRVANDDAYSESTVVACCPSCNAMKSSRDAGEWLSAVERIAVFQRQLTCKTSMTPLNV